MNGPLQPFPVGSGSGSGSGTSPAQPSPLVYLDAKSVLAAQDADEKASLMADLVSELQGGSAQCALPSMFMTDESVVMTCSRPTSIFVTLGFVGIWSLFYRIYYNTLFVHMGRWSHAAVWLLVGAVAYTVYELMLWNYVFDWRRNQLFQSVALSNPSVVTQIYPWATWRNTLVGQNTVYAITIAMALLLCVVFALFATPVLQRGAAVGRFGDLVHDKINSQLSIAAKPATETTKT